MADGYPIYGIARPQAPAAPAPLQIGVKRPRSDNQGVPFLECVGYHPHEEGSGGSRAIMDTQTLNESNEHYLPVRETVPFDINSFSPVTPGLGPVDDVYMRYIAGMVGQSDRYGSGRPEITLPPDASYTLFVEGLPANCTHREVCHIFRPFAGFQEIRLVNRQSRYPGADPFILCFVDFANPSQAAVALDALQGYKFDLLDRDSANLRLQFARFSGPRSAARPHGRR